MNPFGIWVWVCETRVILAPAAFGTWLLCRYVYRAALRWATPAPAVDYDQLLADARQRDLDAINAEAAALTGQAPGIDDALLATCRHLYPDAPAWPRKENDA